MWPEILGCSSKIAEESFPCHKKYFSAEKCALRSALLAFSLSGTYLTLPGSTGVKGVDTVTPSSFIRITGKHKLA